MAYKPAATPSEGEYSSDSDKAHKSSRTRNGTNVDRRIRDYVSKSRSRSRSPYRPSRGEKRRHRDRSRERDRYDQRQFRARYEDGHNDRRGHRRGDAYEDPDPGHSSRSYLRYDEEDDRRPRHKRQRTRSRSRSRSPFRRSRNPDSSRLLSRDDLLSHRDRPRDSGRRGRDTADGRSLREQSVSERGQAPSIAQASKSHAETQAFQAAADTTKVDATSDTADISAQLGERGEPVSLEPVDEAVLIKERRKRREAIRAKYRTQPAPLLVQALEPKGSESVSAVSTPNTSKAMTPESDSRPMSPQTPNLSDPQSPADFDFSKEENLANPDDAVSTGANEEPSAADYDPTVDMREERARHDQSMFHEENTSLTYDAAQVNRTDNSDKQPPKKQKDEFDMFAEETEMDDDMFAPVTSKKTSANGEPGGRAQALDVNLMDNWDDPEGYYITIRDELFADRYVVMHTLGRGMFSSVIRARDTQTDKLVAIKITRNNDTMRKAGLKEISILETLRASDLHDTKHMIRLLTSFDHKGHLCLVFENLSMNLRELLKKFGRDVGLNIKAIRSYAQQLFLGLSLLRKCGIIHADLKPDNVLCSDNHAHIKICDLGSAAPVTDNEIAPYLVSRFYRAPEVMLGIDYDTGIDVWSTGCTLFELYTGKILFTGRNNNGMLKGIMECRGPFPNKLLRRGKMTFDHFDDLLNFYSREEDKLSGRVFTKMMSFKKPTRDLRSRVMPKGKRMVDEGEKRDVELFLDLLDKCLDLRPEKRITPNEALRHPFIMRGAVPAGGEKRK